MQKDQKQHVCQIVKYSCVVICMHVQVLASESVPRYHVMYFACTVITLSDHQEVYERLIGVRVQWRDLGGALGLDQDTLSAIDTMHRGDVQICLREMLTKRLQSGGPLSWRVLCDCLRSPTVKRQDVAEEIEQKIGG